MALCALSHLVDRATDDERLLTSSELLHICTYRMGGGRVHLEFVLNVDHYYISDSLHRVNI